MSRIEADGERPRDAADGLAEWIGRHQTWLFRYLRYIGCGRHTAEDLCQETLIAALRHRVQDRPEETVRAWLRTTARNHYLTQVKRSKLRKERARIDDLDAVFVANEQPEDRVSYQDALTQCVAALDRRSREVLRLRYHDDRSRAEIAIAMGLSEEGVKTMLRRVRDRLRLCVEKRRML